MIEREGRCPYRIGRESLALSQFDCCFFLNVIKVKEEHPASSFSLVKGRGGRRGRVSSGSKVAHALNVIVWYLSLILPFGL